MILNLFHVHTLCITILLLEWLLSDCLFIKATTNSIYSFCEAVHFKFVISNFLVLGLILMVFHLCTDKQLTCPVTLDFSTKTFWQWIGGCAFLLIFIYLLLKCWYMYTKWKSGMKTEQNFLQNCLKNVGFYDDLVTDLLTDIF